MWKERAEINETEKRQSKKQKKKMSSLKRSLKMIKPLVILIKKGREKTQITKIRNEGGAITTDCRDKVTTYQSYF